MSEVYEIRDETDDEGYQSLGVFSTLENALAACRTGSKPICSDHLEADYFEHVTLNIYRRVIDDMQQYPRQEASVEWRMRYDEGGDEYIWEIQNSDDAAAGVNA